MTKLRYAQPLFQHFVDHRLQAHKVRQQRYQILTSFWCLLLI